MSLKSTIQTCAINVKDVHNKHADEKKIPHKRLFTKGLSVVFGLLLIGLAGFLASLEVDWKIYIPILGYGCFNISKEGFWEYTKMIPKLISAIVRGLKGEIVNGDS